MSRLLVLAGTREARFLIASLSALPGLEAIASLAGATEDPAPLACRTRTGGFGGVSGLANYLRAEGISAMIDATHPYARQMQAHAAEAALQSTVPRLRLLRPAWPARPGWRHVSCLSEAAAALPAGARVLLTTGRKDIAAFAERRDVTFLLRTIEPVADLPPHIAPLLARPPFDHEQERALFALSGLSHLITKNAGGTGTAKLDVADEMGLQTLMVDRPAPPPPPLVETPEQAVAWVRETVAIG